MRRRLAVLTALGVAATFTGCASAPASVDIDEARAWAESVQAAQSDGPGAAGAVTLIAGAETAADPDVSEDAGIRLDFENPTSLKRADAACFGGGMVDVSVTIEFGGTALETYGMQLPCDEETHELALAPDTADAAVVSAVGAPETYAYVVLIQEMTVQD